MWLRPTYFMNDVLFVKLHDSLSRRLAYDLRCPEVVQCLRIIPDALPAKHAPVILYEVVHQGAAMYTAYYPLNEQAYRIALPKISLVRFNMSNIYNNRGRVFTCGLEWWDGVGYLYANLDLPMIPEDIGKAHHDLFFFMEALAASMKLHLIPVKLNWYKPGDTR